MTSPVFTCWVIHVPWGWENVACATKSWETRMLYITMSLFKAGMILQCQRCVSWHSSRVPVLGRCVRVLAWIEGHEQQLFSQIPYLSGASLSDKPPSVYQHCHLYQLHSVQALWLYRIPCFEGSLAWSNTWKSSFLLFLHLCFAIKVWWSKALDGACAAFMFNHPSFPLCLYFLGVPWARARRSSLALTVSVSSACVSTS